MPFIHIDHEDIYYKAPPSSAAGPALLAIHGSGGDHTHWPQNLFRLKTCRVHSVDLPGHGRSGGSGLERVEDYADFVQRLVIRLDLPRVILVGHSLGGAIVQMLATRRPAWLAAIVIVGSGARLRVHPSILAKILTEFEATVDLICEWSFGPAAAADLIETVRQGLLRTPPAVTHGDYLACDRFDLMDRIADIRLPTLIVSGSADRLTPVKYGEFLHNRIRRSRLSLLEDAGHMMALEQPEPFITRLNDFFVAELQL
jgi:pimeloyl-ACP methyl ester carboxylesterase